MQRVRRKFWVWLLLMLWVSAGSMLADIPPKFVTTNNDPRLTVAELVANAAGTKPFAFQWLRNGVPIPVANTDTLRITDPKETGAFACEISNNAGKIVTGVVKFANTYVATAPDVLIVRKHKDKE